ncbi:Glutamate--tRNA ligase [Listeria monocytogenes]|nr:Glutamate--tRNA ligase [Listeria monocytogenes]
MEELNEELTVLFRDKVAVTEGEARQMLAGFMFYGEMVFRVNVCDLGWRNLLTCQSR